MRKGWDYNAGKREGQRKEQMKRGRGGRGRDCVGGRGRSRELIWTGINKHSGIHISGTLIFSKLPITWTKSSLSSVEYCDFTPDFLNSPFFFNQFLFPFDCSSGGSKNWDSTVMSWGCAVLLSSHSLWYWHMSSLRMVKVYPLNCLAKFLSF